MELDAVKGHHFLRLNQHFTVSVMCYARLLIKSYYKGRLGTWFPWTDNKDRNELDEDEIADERQEQESN